MARECKKSGCYYPWRITIDGRAHSLKNRKCCLTCVPFKSADRFTNPSSTGKQYSKWNDERKQRHRQLVAQKGKDRKQALVARAGGKCEICGYVGLIMRTMTFHHRNPNDKKFDMNIDSIKSKNWSMVLEEADKCNLLCIRCHLEVEDGIKYLG